MVTLRMIKHIKMLVCILTTILLTSCVAAPKVKNDSTLSGKDGFFLLVLCTNKNYLVLNTRFSVMGGGSGFDIKFDRDFWGSAGKAVCHTEFIILPARQYYFGSIHLTSSTDVGFKNNQEVEIHRSTGIPLGGDQGIYEYVFDVKPGVINYLGVMSVIIGRDDASISIKHYSDELKKIKAQYPDVFAKYPVKFTHTYKADPE